MRLLVLPAVLVVLAVGWVALRGGLSPAPEGVEAEPPVGTPAPRPGPPRLGNLRIRATTPDGSVPPGVEVGYAERGNVRLMYAGEDGSRQFADAPIGEIEVVARAPGYEETRARRQIVAGVPEEVRLVLRPAAD